MRVSTLLSTIFLTLAAASIPPIECNTDSEETLLSGYKIPIRYHLKCNDSAVNSFCQDKADCTVVGCVQSDDETCVSGCFCTWKRPGEIKN
ncbi:hypothetical protein RRF57_000051 [Xylaria bambusicola]|uniref:Uncharacterized protein n=1 Tax=Xylaria bambusicola TaxID=326684 RepID=A0AAN7YTU2_9PEZI